MMDWVGQIVAKLDHRRFPFQLIFPEISGRQRLTDLSHSLAANAHRQLDTRVQCHSVPGAVQFDDVDQHGHHLRSHAVPASRQLGVPLVWSERFLRQWQHVRHC